MASDLSERMAFFLDTNLLDVESEAMQALWWLYESGGIDLRKSTAMDRDLDQDSGLGAERRRARARQLKTEIAVWVLGTSRLGIDTKLGGDEDARIWDQLWDLLGPGRTRPDSRGQHQRDALHIHTAIRSGAKGFITLDGSGQSKGLLHRASGVGNAFGGFMICTPEEALEFVRQRREPR